MILEWNQRFQLEFGLVWMSQYWMLGFTALKHGTNKSEKKPSQPLTLLEGAFWFGEMGG